MYLSLFKSLASLARESSSITCLEYGGAHCGVQVTPGSKSEIGINDYICMLS